jgi:RNA polymerase-binding protein DksA
MRSKGRAVIDTLQAHARRQLMARRHELWSRRQQNEDELSTLGAAQTDWTDQAAQETSAAVLDRLCDGERAELTHIAAALERLDLGTWGTCVVCGKSIAEERLRVMPHATRCAACTAREP